MFNVLHKYWTSLSYIPFWWYLKEELCQFYRLNIERFINYTIHSWQLHLLNAIFSVVWLTFFMFKGKTAVDSSTQKSMIEDKETRNGKYNSLVQLLRS